MGPACHMQVSSLPAECRLQPAYSQRVFRPYCVYCYPVWYIFSNFLIPRAGSTLVVGLSLCILPMVKSLLQDVTTITNGSGSAGIVSCFASKIIACSNPLGLDLLCCSTLEFLDRSVALPQDWYRCRMYCHDASVPGRKSFDAAVNVCGSN